MSQVKPSEVKKFRVHPVLLLVAVLASVLIQIKLNARMSGDVSYKTGSAVGAGIGAALFPFIFGYVAFVIAKRSNLAGNIGFALLAALWIGVRAVRAFEMGSVPSRATSQALMDAAKESQAQGLSGDPERALQANKQLSDAMKGAADELKGIEKAAMLASAAFSSKINETAHAMQDADQALEAGKAFDWSGVKSKEDLDAKVKLFDTAIARTEAMARLIDQSEDLLRADMKERGYEKMEESRFLRDFLAGMGPTIRPTLQKHTCHRNILVAGRDLMVLLRDNYGRWEQQGDKVLFGEDADELIKRFNTDLDTLRTELKREQELIGELKEIMRRQAGQGGAGKPRPKPQEKPGRAGGAGSGGGG